MFKPIARNPMAPGVPGGEMPRRQPMQPMMGTPVQQQPGMPPMAPGGMAPVGNPGMPPAAQGVPVHGQGQQLATTPGNAGELGRPWDQRFPQK